MIMTQTRRRFLTMTALAGAASILPPRRVGGRASARDHYRPAAQDAGYLLGPAICVRGTAAGRGV